MNARSALETLVILGAGLVLGACIAWLLASKQRADASSEQFAKAAQELSASAPAIALQINALQQAASAQQRTARAFAGSQAALSELVNCAVPPAIASVLADQAVAVEAANRAGDSKQVDVPKERGN